VDIDSPEKNDASHGLPGGSNLTVESTTGFQTVWWLGTGSGEDSQQFGRNEQERLALWRYAIVFPVTGPRAMAAIHRPESNGAAANPRSRENLNSNASSTMTNLAVSMPRGSASAPPNTALAAKMHVCFEDVILCRFCRMISILSLSS